MIAAERTLFVQSNGTRVPVSIRIDVPVFDRNAWVSDFSIGWPEGTFRHHGMGSDSAHALLAAFQFVAIQLYASPHHQRGTLVWDETGAGYGFPLPGDSRDLASGRDRDL